MKVAICLHPIADLGGIINHTEQLAAGLKDIGCDTSLFVLKWTDKLMKPKAEKDFQGYEIGAFGIPFHQRHGWYLTPYESIWPYKRREDRTAIKHILSQFDLVIWSVPVPTKQNANEGNNVWPELYDLPTRQIAVIHDANVEAYPWLLHVSERLSGLVCVHEAAFNTAAATGMPRAMIVNPFKVPKHTVAPYEERTRGWLSVQNFKALKRVGDLVRAVPYMETPEKILAGGGIEYYYMTTKDKKKLKPQYVEDGEKIWDRAVRHGMTHVGWVANKVRDAMLKKYRCLIDPSWTMKYAKAGGHFNRVFIEAIAQGTIPIGRNYGISDNIAGISRIWKPGKNYIMIPHTATPREFAEIVDGACNMDVKQALEIQERNINEVLPMFERSRVASDYIKLAFANGKPGIVSDLKWKDPSSKLLDSAEKHMENFFRL